MKQPKPDKNGVYVFDASPLKKIPLATLIVFSAVIIVLSVYYLIAGAYDDLTVPLVRILSCTAVLLVSVFMLIKRDRYIITGEKVMLYGKWEIYFSEIEAVLLHGSIFGFVEIKTVNGTQLIPSTDISCGAAAFAGILSEKIRITTKKGNHRK